MTNKWKNSLRLVLLILTTLGLSVNCFAAPLETKEKKTIRVGYQNNCGIHVERGGTVYSGCLYEYLQEIAKHTGWVYEFVQVDWEEGIEALETGRIDLLGPLTKTPERQQLFAFPEQAMGTEYGALYVSSSNKNIYYNDVASFQGMRIGTTKSNSYIKDMDEFCEKNGITVEYVYLSPAKYEDALQAGEVDGFLAGSFLDVPQTTVVQKLSVQPYYYATAKDNQAVLDDLNQALEQIFLDDAYFASDLEQRYNSNRPIGIPAFTREEMQFTQEHPVLRVAYDPAWSPIEYYDEHTERASGISIDVLAEISAISGIAFEYVPSEDYEQSKEMLKTGQADLMLGYFQREEDAEVVHTTPFLEVPVMLVGYKNVSRPDKPKVVVPNLDSDTTQQIMREYPNFTFVNYHNTSNVLRAAYEGKEDYFFINTYTFDELARRETPQNFITIPTKVKIPLRIRASSDADPRMMSILNKAIRRLTPEQISTVVFSNTVNRAYSIPLAQRMRDFTPMILVSLALFFVCILLLSIRNQRNLRRLAYVDELTGISTLAKFQMDAHGILKNAAPGEYAMLTLDIDDFKYINDSFGYEIGSRILITLTGYFKERLDQGELIGRTSADNFIFLVKNKPSESSQSKWSVVYQMRDHFQGILPEHYTVSFSIGAYVITNTQEDFSLLLDKANFARKSIKGNSLQMAATYTDEMNKQVEWKKDVTFSMDRALVDNEFEVYLQPKYRLGDEKLIGAEALVRWNHPEKGMLTPVMFIPIFEQNGFIKKLDYYVFERVCALMQRWERQAMSGVGVPISVNLSRLHLTNPHLVEELVEMTLRYGVPTTYIEIELTESIVFYNTGLLVETMGKLRNAGFQISIDDFGSGYSSLNMLKDLPVDVIKIDKGFLSDSAEVYNGRVIIDAMTKMAKCLHLVTVAEGVETKEQAEMLSEMGCDIAQGYYYAKPMPIVEFEQLLQ